MRKDGKGTTPGESSSSSAQVTDNPLQHVSVVVKDIASVPAPAAAVPPAPQDALFSPVVLKNNPVFVGPPGGPQRRRSSSVPPIKGTALKKKAAKGGWRHVMPWPSSSHPEQVASSDPSTPNPLRATAALQVDAVAPSSLLTSETADSAVVSALVGSLSRVAESSVVDALHHRVAESSGKAVLGVAPSLMESSVLVAPKLSATAMAASNVSARGLPRLVRRPGFRKLSPSKRERTESDLAADFGTKGRLRLDRFSVQRPALQDRTPLQDPPRYPASVGGTANANETSELYKSIANLDVGEWREYFSENPMAPAFFVATGIALFFAAIYFPVNNGAGWFLEPLFSLVKELTPDFNPRQKASVTTARRNAILASEIVGYFISAVLLGGYFWYFRNYLKQLPSQPARYENLQAILAFISDLPVTTEDESIPLVIRDSFDSFSAEEANAFLNLLRRHIHGLKNLKEGPRYGQRSEDIAYSFFWEIYERLNGQHDQRYDAMIRLVLNIYEHVLLRMKAKARSAVVKTVKPDSRPESEVKALGALGTDVSVQLQPLAWGEDNSDLSAAIKLTEESLEPLPSLRRRAPDGASGFGDGFALDHLPGPPDVTGNSQLRSLRSFAGDFAVGVPGFGVAGSPCATPGRSRAASASVRPPAPSMTRGVFATPGTRSSVAISVAGSGVIDGRQNSPWYKLMLRLLGTEKIKIDDIIAELRKAAHGDESSLNAKFAENLEKQRPARGGPVPPKTCKFLLETFFDRYANDKEAMFLAYTRLETGKPYSWEAQEGVSGVVTVSAASAESREQLREFQEVFAQLQAQVEGFKTSLSADCVELAERILELEAQAGDNTAKIRDVETHLRQLISVYSSSMEQINDYIRALSPALIARDTRMLAQLQHYLTEQQGELAEQIEGLFAQLIGSLNVQLGRLEANDFALRSGVVDLVFDLNDVFSTLRAEIGDVVEALYGNQVVLMEMMRKSQAHPELQALLVPPLLSQPDTETANPATYGDWLYLLIEAMRKQFDKRGDSHANTQQRLRVLRYILQNAELKKNSADLSNVLSAFFCCWTKWISEKSLVVLKTKQQEASPLQRDKKDSAVYTGRRHDIKMLLAAKPEEMGLVMANLLAGQAFHQELAIEIMGYQRLSFKERITFLALVVKQGCRESLLRQVLFDLINDAQKSFGTRTQEQTLIKLLALMRVESTNVALNAFLKNKTTEAYFSSSMPQNFDLAQAVLRILANPYSSPVDLDLAQKTVWHAEFNAARPALFETIFAETELVLASGESDETVATMEYAAAKAVCLAERLLNPIANEGLRAEAAPYFAQYLRNEYNPGDPPPNYAQRFASTLLAEAEGVVKEDVAEKRSAKKGDIPGGPGVEGLTFVPAPSDGHCFFHAVANMHFNGKQRDLRVRVVQYIRRNIEDYINQINGEIAERFVPDGEGFREMTSEDYLLAMEHGQEWADDIVRTALMRDLGRLIVVVGPDGRLRNLPDELTDERFNGEPIFIYYNGVDHYDAFALTDSVTLNAWQIIENLRGAAPAERINPTPERSTAMRETLKAVIANSAEQETLALFRQTAKQEKFSEATRQEVLAACFDAVLDVFKPEPPAKLEKTRLTKAREALSRIEQFQEIIETPRLVRSLLGKSSAGDLGPRDAEEIFQHIAAESKLDPLITRVVMAALAFNKSEVENASRASAASPVQMHSRSAAYWLNKVGDSLINIFNQGRYQQLPGFALLMGQEPFTNLFKKVLSGSDVYGTTSKPPLLAALLYARYAVVYADSSLTPEQRAACARQLCEYLQAAGLLVGVPPYNRAQVQAVFNESGLKDAFSRCGLSDKNFASVMQASLFGLEGPAMVQQTNPLSQLTSPEGRRNRNLLSRYLQRPNAAGDSERASLLHTPQTSAGSYGATEGPDVVSTPISPARASTRSVMRPTSVRRGRGSERRSRRVEVTELGVDEARLGAVQEEGLLSPLLTLGSPAHDALPPEGTSLLPGASSLPHEDAPASDEDDAPAAASASRAVTPLAAPTPPVQTTLRRAMSRPRDRLASPGLAPMLSPPARHAQRSWDGGRAVTPAVAARASVAETNSASRGRGRARTPMPSGARVPGDLDAAPLPLDAVVVEMDGAMPGAMIGTEAASSSATQSSAMGTFLSGLSRALGLSPASSVPALPTAAASSPPGASASKRGDVNSSSDTRRLLEESDDEESVASSPPPPAPAPASVPPLASAAPAVASPSRKIDFNSPGSPQKLGGLIRISESVEGRADGYEELSDGSAAATAAPESEKRPAAVASSRTFSHAPFRRLENIGLAKVSEAIADVYASPLGMARDTAGKAIVRSLPTPPPGSPPKLPKQAAATAPAAAIPPHQRGLSAQRQSSVQQQLPARAAVYRQPAETPAAAPNPNQPSTGGLLLGALAAVGNFFSGFAARSSRSAEVPPPAGYASLPGGAVFSPTRGESVVAANPLHGLPTSKGPVIASSGTQVTISSNPFSKAVAAPAPAPAPAPVAPPPLTQVFRNPTYTASGFAPLLARVQLDPKITAGPRVADHPAIKPTLPIVSPPPDPRLARVLAAAGDKGRATAKADAEAQARAREELIEAEKQAAASRDARARAEAAPIQARAAAAAAALERTQVETQRQSLARAAARDRAPNEAEAQKQLFHARARAKIQAEVQARSVANPVVTAGVAASRTDAVETRGAQDTRVHENPLRGLAQSAPIPAPPPVVEAGRNAAVSIANPMAVAVSLSRPASSSALPSAPAQPAQVSVPLPAPVAGTRGQGKSLAMAAQAQRASAAAAPAPAPAVPGPRVAGTGRGEDVVASTNPFHARNQVATAAAAPAAAAVLPRVAGTGIVSSTNPVHARSQAATAVAPPPTAVLPRVAGQGLVALSSENPMHVADQLSAAAAAPAPTDPHVGRFGIPEGIVQSRSRGFSIGSPPVTRLVVNPLAGNVPASQLRSSAGIASTASSAGGGLTGWVRSLISPPPADAPVAASTNPAFDLRSPLGLPPSPVGTPDRSSTATLNPVVGMSGAPRSRVRVLPRYNLQPPPATPENVLPGIASPPRRSVRAVLPQAGQSAIEFGFVGGAARAASQSMEPSAARASFSATPSRLSMRPGSVLLPPPAPTPPPTTTPPDEAKKPPQSPKR